MRTLSLESEQAVKSHWTCESGDQQGIIRERGVLLEIEEGTFCVLGSYFGKQLG